MSDSRVMSKLPALIAAILSALMDETFHVPMLTGNNFSDWKENLLFTLGCLELDLALRENEPPDRKSTRLNSSHSSESRMPSSA